MTITPRARGWARARSVWTHLGRRVLSGVVLGWLVAIGCAFLIADVSRITVGVVELDELAPRTVRAPFDFFYVDAAQREELRAAAADSVLPVFVRRHDLVADRLQRLGTAFSDGRSRLAALAGADESGSAPKLSADLKTVVLHAFLDPLRVPLAEGVAHEALELSFSPGIERQVRQLLQDALGGAPIAFPGDLAAGGWQHLTVIDVGAEGQEDERTIAVDDVEALDEIKAGLARSATDPASSLAAAIASALLVPTLSFDPLTTAERREEARAAVDVEPVRVRNGQVLFWEGTVIGREELAVYNALRERVGDRSVVGEVAALSSLVFAICCCFVVFGARQLRSFRTDMRALGASAFLLFAAIFVARTLVSASEPLAASLGAHVRPQSVWFALPLSGFAMLVRLLLGPAWALVYVAISALLVGILLDGQVLPASFFLVSGVAGVVGVANAHERIAIMRAGVFVGIVNAGMVLVVSASQTVGLSMWSAPLWSIFFALAGALAGSVLVLGFIPLFEGAGFVTNYRLLELGSLNHPLLRRLMLRAPGSYHHSVVVGTLAEAGSEAIGANALLSKVAAHFHDVGKSLQPHYFIENQTRGPNAHDALGPVASAERIIAHVVEGAKLAEAHGLPKPIVDNILMHHGTGTLRYFLDRAREGDAEVDVALFRYPGPKPDTREAGILMLADKIEAATRTLRTPSEDNIKQLIRRIVNSVIADGQFSRCPLSVQEINILMSTFLASLMGIYHARVDYPETADLALQQRTPLPVASHTRSDEADYEAARYLPVE